jgi:hypothetical protein
MDPALLAEPSPVLHLPVSQGVVWLRNLFAERDTQIARKPAPVKLRTGANPGSAEGSARTPVAW